VVPISFYGLLNTLRLQAGNVIPGEGIARTTFEGVQKVGIDSHNGINATLMLGCALNVVADLIADPSVTFIASIRDIAWAKEALKKHPIHAVLSHPMEVSTRRAD